MTTIPELIKKSGMSIKEFSDAFGIPYRTLQNWNLGIRPCPEYVARLIEYKLEGTKNESVDQ